VHINPTGAGDGRPTAMDIIKDEGLRGQWQGKVVLITGASNGIGVETARALYATGAHLFLPVRDVKKGEAVAEDIRQTLPESKGRIDVLPMTLDSLQSVRECATAFLSQSKVLHVLICNAGVMVTPEGTTVDGFETQFGTNHLAHFLLFQLLKPTLLASSSPSFNSRVISVSSSAHGFASIFPGDYDLKKRGYDHWIAYGQSKTANIYMANEIDRRYGDQGLHALSLHPGSIRSGLQVHLTPAMVEDTLKRIGLTTLSSTMNKNAAQGAATTVWASTAKVWEGKGGKFLENCNEALPRVEGDPTSGYAPHVYDADAAKQLWTDSCNMIGIAPEDD